MNKKNTMEQKITNSKLDIVKKSLYFIIAPIVILIVGIILMTTVGFSQGIDFSGGQTFKVYVNDQAKLENATVYDLNNAKDYDDVYKKITLVLNKSNVDIVSYQTTKIDLPEYSVSYGQAIKVAYQTNSNSKDASTIRAELVEAFEYADYDGAISSIDVVPPLQSYDWMIGLVASVMFGLIASIIYMAIRFSRSAIFVIFIQVALDIFLTLGLMLICRVTVNLTSGIIILATLMFSLINSFVFYNKIRESRASGLYEGAKNNEIANKTTKQLLWKKAMFYLAGIVALVLLIIFTGNAISSVSVGIMLSLIATFYTSTFLLPSFWAIVDKPKKAKKKA